MVDCDASKVLFYHFLYWKIKKNTIVNFQIVILRVIRIISYDFKMKKPFVQPWNFITFKYVVYYMIENSREFYKPQDLIIFRFF